jgi:type I restriction enzyme M protein
LNNIQSIVGLYRGENSVFNKTVEGYFTTINEHMTELTAKAQDLVSDYRSAILPTLETALPKLWLNKWNETIDQEDISFTEQVAEELVKTRLIYNEKSLVTLDKTVLDHLKKAKRGYNNFLKAINSFVKEAGKEDDLRKNRDWKSNVLDKLKEMETDFSVYSQSIDQILYFNKEANWLLSRFPNAEYADIAGLCKVVTKEEIAQNDYSLTAGRYVGVAPQIDEDFDYEERMAEIKVELRSLNEEAINLAEQIQLNLNELGL